eukprot:UN10081
MSFIVLSLLIGRSLSKFLYKKQMFCLKKTFVLLKKICSRFGQFQSENCYVS